MQEASPLVSLRVSPTNKRDVQLPSKPLTKSYIHAACTEPLKGSTIGEILHEAAEHVPNRQGFMFPEFESSYTFAEILQQSRTVAKSFLALGLKKGDTLLCGTIVDVNWLTVFYGATMIGVIHSKPYLFSPAEIFTESCCQLIDCHTMVMGECNYDMLMTLSPELKVSETSKLKKKKVPTVRNVIMMGTKKSSGILSMDEFLELGKGISDEVLENAESKVDINDTACILFTSGTTGNPKAVCQSHLALVNIPYFMQLRRIPNDVVAGDDPMFIILTCNPKHDDFACIMHCVSGLTDWQRYTQVVFLPSTYEGESEHCGPDFIELIQNYKVTHCDVYPFYWTEVLKSKYYEQYNLKSLRGGLLGTIPITGALIEQLKCYIPEYDNMYGMSEIMGITKSIPADNFERRINTTGFPYPHEEIKIIDKENLIVPVGEIGEICVRGYAVFNGYYNQPEKTKEIVDTRGWLHTGDLGFMDNLGFIKVMGRKQDAIQMKNQYGDVVYPIVIEQVAKAYPKVVSANAVHVMNKSGTTTQIVLCIIVKKDQQLEKDEIQKFCESKLLERDFPQHYLFMDSFPIGQGVRKKVSKKKLIKIAEEMLGITH